MHSSEGVKFLWAAFEVPTDETQVTTSLLAYFTNMGRE